MDIEHFYDANPRRRHSSEYSFGNDWTDAGGTRWELNWVQDTGELYIMREAGEPLVMDPLGDTVVPDLPASQVTVEILGVIEGLESVEATVAGWSTAMPERGSIQWVRDRVGGTTGADTDTGRSTDPPPSHLDGSS